jgi:predicted transposase YdaD
MKCFHVDDYFCKKLKKTKPHGRFKLVPNLFSRFRKLEKKEKEKEMLGLDIPSTLYLKSPPRFAKL